MRLGLKRISTLAFVLFLAACGRSVTDDLADAEPSDVTTPAGSDASCQPMTPCKRDSDCCPAQTGNICNTVTAICCHGIGCA